jgi:transposase
VGLHRRALRLLDRLWTYQYEALAYLAGFVVPIDTNQAEQDLRPVTVQHKISSTFRSVLGVGAFSSLRTALSTW